MSRNNGALLLALVTCAFTTLTFAVLKVDYVPVKTDISRGQKSRTTPSNHREILSQRKIATVGHPLISNSNRNEDLPGTLQPEFSARAASKINENPGISESTEGLLLLNYLHQFNPSSKAQLDSILQVAHEARIQLSRHQADASEQLQKVRGRLDVLIDEASSSNSEQAQSRQGYQLFDRYFGLLEDRHQLSKAIALQQEKLDALELRKTFVDLKTALIDSSLEDEKQILHRLQLELSRIDTELKQLDVSLSSFLDGAPGHLAQEIHEQIRKYKSGLDASTDQDVIVEKFENILAAAEYLDFKEI